MLVNALTAFDFKLFCGPYQVSMVAHDLLCIIRWNLEPDLIYVLQIIAEGQREILSTAFWTDFSDYFKYLIEPQISVKM